MQTPNPDIPNIPNTPEVGTELTSVPPGRPCCSRCGWRRASFRTLRTASELFVRVYPDKVHIDSHEPGLTADELTWGQHFWEQTWRCGNDMELARVAWQQLADRFDPPRAAWIAQALKPLNPPADRPNRPVAPISRWKPVQFPSPDQGRDMDAAPHTRVLPNRWILLGYRGGQLVVNVQGVPSRMFSGDRPRPSPRARCRRDGIDEGMRWMVDFDAAEKVGMGIRVRLTGARPLRDWISCWFWASRMRRTVDSTAGELLDAHHYTGGLSFVAQGTPSNNTEDAPSGFSSRIPATKRAIWLNARPGSCARQLHLARDRTPRCCQPLGLANAGPVFANLPGATAVETAGRTAHEHRPVAGHLGLFPLADAGVGRSDESPLTDDGHRLGAQPFHRLRACGRAPACSSRRQTALWRPSRNLSRCLEAANRPGEPGIPRRRKMRHCTIFWSGCVTFGGANIRRTPSRPKRGDRSRKRHRQRPGRGPEHGGTFVQLLDPPPDGTPLPGAPHGFSERRLFRRCLAAGTQRTDPASQPAPAEDAGDRGVVGKPGTAGDRRLARRGNHAKLAAGPRPVWATRRGAQRRAGTGGSEPIARAGLCSSAARRNRPRRDSQSDRAAAPAGSAALSAAAPCAAAGIHRRSREAAGQPRHAAAAASSGAGTGRVCNGWRRRRPAAHHAALRD